MAPSLSSGVRLRRPRNADIPRLVEIERSSFAAWYYRDHRLSARDFADLIKRRKTFFRVAEYRQKVIGDLIGDMTASKSRRLARLDSIAVDPKWQGRSVGRRLAKSFVVKARRAGYYSVVLEVAAPNLAAQHLFTGLGFRKYRKLLKYYSGRVDGIRMTLRFR